MIVNFAEPAHNHNRELDPVVRSLLDTDFYKVLMVRSSLDGRSKTLPHPRRAAMEAAIFTGWIYNLPQRTRHCCW
jgi:hypothetical protein